MNLTDRVAVITGGAGGLGAALGRRFVAEGARVIAASGPVLTPDQVADATIAGLAEERFLFLPHPEVAGYARRRAEDPDGWQAGLRKLVRKLRAAGPAT